MTDIKSMTLEELTQTLREMGQPAFRGGQVFTWLHRGVTSFEEMSDLPRALREQLAQTFHITAPTVARKQESRLDGTVKYCGSWRTATASRRCSCSITTATPCASPLRWAAAWAAPSAPAPSPERSVT